MPLKVGNMWIFNIYEIDNDTGKIDDVCVDTSLITGIDEVSNTQWYIDRVARLTNKTDGLWVWYDWANGTQPSLFLKHPSEVGDNYSYIGFLGREENVLVVSTDTLIVITSGQYSCYHYRFIHIGTNGKTTLDYFASISNGLIKGEKHFTRPDGSTFLDNSFELIGLVLK